MSAEELERWRAKQAHYQDPRVARDYDAARFSGARAAGSTARKWAAIRRVLGAEFDAVESVLDVPCGTGRFAALLAGSGKRFVEADLSHAMLAEALTVAAGARAMVVDERAVAERNGGPADEKRSHLGCVRCDAAQLPFADASFDVVLSIRFLFHVPRELRPALLAEMARVARRAVVVDVRHKYTLGAWTRPLRACLTRKRVPYRASLAELEADFAAAGLRIERRAWIAPLFSEKLVVAARPERRNS